MFFKAVELFNEKWKILNNHSINNFLEYFNFQWVTKLNGWYEGYSFGYPSTTNALEATNNVIKKEGTVTETIGTMFFKILNF